MANYPIKLRPAKREDADMLLEWRNNYKTRKYFFDSRKIRKEEHYKWFNKLLDSEDKKLLIIIDRYGKPVGNVRFNIEGKEAETSISIIPEMRGKGYGTRALEKASDYALKNFDIDNITAKIKKDNLASIKSFSNAGFIEIGKNENITMKRYKRGAKNYIIASVKSWNIENYKKLKKENKKNKLYLITSKEELNYDNIKKINPRYIFFPHWSWIIPEEIYTNYECIVFHMTDLPFGRGGSPLQNLIVRGVYNTKLSAIRVTKGIDAGPIYMKKPLSLEGKAEDIYKKASDISFNIIRKMIKKEISPKEQKGKVIIFKRRKPEQSNIKGLNSLRKIYDYIRMLDAEGYPRAFVNASNLRFEFSKALLKKDYLEADVEIKIKKNK